MGMLGIAVWWVYGVAMQSGFGIPRFWNIGVQVLVTLFGAGWVLLGHTLWSGRGSPAPRD